MPTSVLFADCGFWEMKDPSPTGISDCVEAPSEVLRNGMLLAYLPPFGLALISSGILNCLTP